MKDALELIRNLNGKFEDETMKWNHLICEQINTSGASSAPPLSGKFAVIMKDYLAGFYEIGKEIESDVYDLCCKNSALQAELETLKEKSGYTLINAGEYSSEKTYNLCDVVHYITGTYACCKTCKGILPTSDSTVWKLISGTASNDMEEKYNSLYRDYSATYVDYLATSKEYELFKENVNISDFDLSKLYVPGNIVYYKDELYLNVKQCSGVSPRIKNMSWKKISMSAIMNGINKSIIDKLHYDGLYESTMTYSEGTIIKYNNHLWVSLMDDNKVEPTKRDKNGCCTWWGISNSDKLVVRSNDYERTFKDKINATRHIKRLKDENTELVIKYNDIQSKLRIMSANISDLIRELKTLTSPLKSESTTLEKVLSCKGRAVIIYNEIQELLEPLKTDLTADMVLKLNQIINFCHVNIEDIHQTDEDALETLDDIEAREEEIIKLVRKMIEKIIGESIDT